LTKRVEPFFCIFLLPYRIIIQFSNFTEVL
jgi:hypothetical protein